MAINYARKIWLNCIILVGLWLRWPGMFDALWYDEAFSVWLAQLSLPRLIEAALNDVHPPFYYMLLWVIGRIFGYSEFVMRLPSLLAGLALIAVVHRLAKSYGLTDKSALVAAAITAIAPFQIYYSTEARFYALQMLVIALAALGLAERRYWLLVAGSLAALYLQNMSVFFVGPLWVLAMVQNRKMGLYCGLMIGIGYLPGALLAAYQAMAVGDGFWVLPIDNPGQVLDTLSTLLFYFPRQPFLVGVVAFLGIIMVLADGRRLWEHRRAAVVMAAVPLLLNLIVSLSWQSVFITRGLAAVTPALYILIADTIAVSPRRLAVWGGSFAVMALVIAACNFTGYAGRQPASLTYNIPGYQAGDGIYHVDVGSLVLWHYYYPDAKHKLYPQNDTLASARLTTATKQAMGIEEGYLSNERWFISYDTVTTTPKEAAYSQSIKKGAYDIRTLHDDRLLTSKIYMVISALKISR